MLGFLIKASQNGEALEMMVKHFTLMTSVIVRVIQSADSW